MLNLTVSRIFLEKDKKAAYQFVLGAAIVVLAQFFLSLVIVSSINKFPNILFWLKNISIFIFAFVSLFFLIKGATKDKKKPQKNYKNNFIHGLVLSFINMFAIPFFVVSYSLLMVEGFVRPTSANILIFAVGVFFGVIAILISYVLLMKKFKRNLQVLTGFINPTIGVITGFFTIYSAVNLYL